MSFAKQFRSGRLRKPLRSVLWKSLPAVFSFLERPLCLRMAFIACGLGILVFSIPSRAMESAQDTLYRRFLDPPRQYSPMPFWFWNGKMEGPKIQEQIRKMVGQHVYGAFLYGINRLETPYLSEEWWQAIGAGLEESKRLGFKLNFIDEYSWPSGEARNNRKPENQQSEVLARHPEYHMKSLSFRMQRVQGPRKVDLPTSETMQAIVAARWLGNKKIDGSTLRLVASADSKESQTWLVPEGEWALISFYLEPSSGFDGGKVDLLNPDATKLFFDLTYGEFYRRYGSYFGNTVQMGFSDHEGDYGYRIAWTPRLFQEFEKRHHYDLRKVLPLLVFDGGDFSIKARCDYLGTATELYSKSFWQGLTTAAQGLGLSRTGHAWEETLQFGAALEGSLFAVERGLNPVGVDSLSDSGRQAVSFKVAQSVADFEGRSFLCEHEGIHGIDSYLDLEGIRQATNAIAGWGVDLFVPHAFNYDAAHATFPPDWFNQPYWPYFHYYADYLRRLSYMNSESRHVAPILLYYPMTSLWAHIDPVLSGQVEYKQVYDPEAWDNPTTAINDYYTRLILKLSEHQWDHLIADDAYLEKAVIEGNELVIGSQRFTAIVLPPLSTLRRSTLNKLIDFHQAGGTIFGIRFLPDSSPDAGGNDPVIKEGIVRLFGPAGSRSGLYSENRSQGGGRSFFISYQVETLIDLLDGSLPKDFQVTEGPEDHLFYQHRHKQGQHYYWVVNDSERPRSNRAMFSQTGVPEKWDAMTGERSPLFYVNRPNGTEVRLTFSPWDAYYVVFRPLTKAPQEVELIRTNAETLDIVSQEDTSIRVHLTAPSTPPGAEVVLRRGGQVYQGRTNSLPLSSISLEEGWQFRPQPERISIPYARTMDAEKEDGVRSGWTQADFDDSSWPSVWLSESQNTIRNWNIMGPFPNPDDSAFKDPFPPKTFFEGEQELPGGNHEKIHWEQYFGDEPNLKLGFGWVEVKNGAFDDSAHIVQFDRLLPTRGKSWIVSYALTYLYSPKPQQVQFLFTADNNAQVWLNQSLVFQDLRHPAWLEFNEHWINPIPVRLEAGWNQVLVKVGLGKHPCSDYYGFSLRVADSSGRTVRDIVNGLSPNDLNHPLPSPAGDHWYRMTIPPGCVSLFPPSLTKPYRLYVNGISLAHTSAQPIDLRKYLGKKEKNVLTLSVSAEDRLTSPLEFQTGFTPLVLKPWTAMGLENFSGTAVYERNFSLPSSYQGRRLILDLGRVCSVAEVYLNGNAIGTAIWRPYRFDLTRYLKPGSNQLRILVTNTESNRRAVGASRKLLAKIDQDGLAGPVSLIPYFDETIVCETKPELSRLGTVPATTNQ